MQINGTSTPNSPPSGLAERQLSIEMGNTPPRLWVGCPTSIDPSGRVQVSPPLDYVSTAMLPLSVANGGIPAGGAINFYLAKNSATDRDVVWRALGDLGSTTTVAGVNAYATVLAGTPSGNTVFGANSYGYNADGGSNNTVVGSGAFTGGYGASHTVIGAAALRTPGAGSTGNAAVGMGALGSASGSNNTAVGFDAGRLYGAAGTAMGAATGSVFIGSGTRPFNTAQTNQIVIGADAVGRGSNTVTLGTDAITQLWCGGRDILAATAGGPFLPQIGGQLYQAGQSDRLTMAADAGQDARIRYSVTGQPAWLSGERSGGWFEIADAGGTLLQLFTPGIERLISPAGSNANMQLGPGGGDLWTLGATAVAGGRFQIVNETAVPTEYAMIISGGATPNVTFDRFVVAPEIQSNGDLYVSGDCWVNNVECATLDSGSTTINGTLNVASTITAVGNVTANGYTGVFISIAGTIDATGGTGTITAANNVQANGTLIANGGVLQIGGIGQINVPNGILRLNGQTWPAVDNTYWCGSPTVGEPAWFGVSAYTYDTKSDPSLKRDIAEVPAGALAKVMSLRAKRFHWREEAADSPLHYGFMAPEVHSVMGDDFAGWHGAGISYNELLAVLWSAVQELASQGKGQNHG